MDGLNTRIAFAKAKMSVFIFGRESFEDGAPEEMWRALLDAEADGFLAGIADGDMPALYRDEQPLVYFWKHGNDQGILTEEMRNCSDCENEHGYPCSIHG